MSYNHFNFSGSNQNLLQQEFANLFQNTGSSFIDSLLSLSTANPLNNVLDFGSTPMNDDANTAISNLLSVAGNKAPQEGYEIFISGLSPDVTEIELITKFQPFGEITNCSIVRNRYNQKRLNGPRSNFAYCDYTKRKDAEQAIHLMNGKKVGNHPIKVTWSNRNKNRDVVEISCNEKTLENSISVPSLENTVKDYDTEEAPTKRSKQDEDLITETPLQTANDENEDTYKNKISEDLLKISNFETVEETNHDMNPIESCPGSPNPVPDSVASDIEDVQNTSSADKAQSENIEEIEEMKVYRNNEKLKAKIEKLESDNMKEHELRIKENGELKKQIQQNTEMIKGLNEKMLAMEQQSQTTKGPSKEEFESLSRKLEILEQTKISKEPEVAEGPSKAEFESLCKKIELLEQTKIPMEPLVTTALDDKENASQEVAVIEQKQKDETKTLSDIDVCILNLSQTINGYFKKLAGRTMSGQKEKDEELMMERLRSLEPIQTIVYEKLRWFLSMGGASKAEMALKSAAKISKHFPFLLAFLGFNYHDLIMMSIGNEGEISQSDGAIRLSRWFTNILKEKTEGDKKIWPSSISPNMLASILTEHFVSTTKQLLGSKQMSPKLLNQTVTPISVNATESKSLKNVPLPHAKEKDISIVGEFPIAESTRVETYQKINGALLNLGNAKSQPAKVESSQKIIGGVSNNPGNWKNLFAPSMDMRTLGTNQPTANRPGLQKFSNPLLNKNEMKLTHMNQNESIEVPPLLCNCHFPNKYCVIHKQAGGRNVMNKNFQF